MGNIFFFKSSGLAVGPMQLPLYWVLGVLSQVKSGWSPPSGAEVKNEGSCTSSVSVCLHDVFTENFMPLTSSYTIY